MRFLSLILLLTLGLPSLSVGQSPYDQWFFGKNAGLSFQGPQAFPLVTGSLSTTEGSSSLLDEQGHLLFYTDGSTVWGRNHQPMPNGHNLSGNVSATQSALIVPWPTQAHRYFLFTTGEWSQNTGLRFSMVDMQSNNGMGDVSLKNNLLASNISERLTAIRHANQRDYWVLTHRQYTNEFLAYRVGPQGISLPPVISRVGSIDSSAVGYLKASFDGKKVAMALRNQHSYELYDFDPTSGQLSKPLTLPSFFYQSYGLEFSPDGSKLYLHASRFDTGGPSPQPSRLYQLNLKAGSPTDIINSITLVSPINVAHPGAMQLGPDGKIYIARHDALYLGVIRQPNALGSACNYVDEGIFLGGRRSQFGLCNPIQAEIFPQADFQFSATCEGDSTFFQGEKLVAVDSVTWDFDDPGKSNPYGQGGQLKHRFSKAGTYSVTMVVHRGDWRDSIRKPVRILPQPRIAGLGDTALCPGQSLKLDVRHPYADSLATRYLWSTSATQSSILLDQAGLYWVEASNLCGVTRDSLFLSYRELPQLNLPPDTLICEDSELSLDFSGQEDWQIRWYDGSQQLNRNFRRPGTYWLEARDRCGVDRDTFRLEVEAFPRVSLGPDTFFCEGGFLLLEAFPNPVNPATRYLWENGDTEAVRLVEQPGKYQVEVRGKACVTRDSVEVEVKKAPVVELGQDTLLCEGERLLLQLPAQGSEYRWQNGHGHPFFEVTRSGTYWVEAENACGKAKDEIDVRFHKPVSLELGRDTVLCPYESLQLNVASGAGGVAYRWQDGSTFPYFLIEEAGTYHVSLENACGLVRDSIRVGSSLEQCECRLFIPNVFSPNQDGVNDCFVVDYPCDLQQYQLNIFDRWGRLVFAADSPNEIWDGTQGARPCPRGVYFYVLNFQPAEQTNQPQREQPNTLKGSITLMR
jgi:gliding motility-associated-like protein